MFDVSSTSDFLDAAGNTDTARATLLIILMKSNLLNIDLEAYGRHPPAPGPLDPSLGRDALADRGVPAYSIVLYANMPAAACICHGSDRSYNMSRFGTEQELRLRRTKLRTLSHCAQHSPEQLEAIRDFRLILQYSTNH